MTWDEKFSSLVEKFKKEVRSIKTIKIISAQGLPIWSELKTTKNKRGEYIYDSRGTSLWESVIEYASHFNCHDLKDIIILGKDSYTILLADSMTYSESIILAVIDLNVNLKEVLPELRRFADNLHELL